MTEFLSRLKKDLEPLLESPDPRGKISAYHDMPYAIFRYDPREEFELRKQVSLLATRLQNRGKRITRISLAECLREALESQYPLKEWFEVERSTSVEDIVKTIANVLEDDCPLIDLVAKRIPTEQDPKRDIVFVVRTGALFPVYRTFSLLEQLKGRIGVPAILFYPGELDGPAGLRFMGVLQAEHNYRPKII